MQNEITTDHFVLFGVAQIDQHRNQAAAMVDMRLARVADKTLVDVDPDPQLVRLMLDLADVARFFVLAGLPIGDIPRLAQIDHTAIGTIGVCELPYRIIDEFL